MTNTMTRKSTFQIVLIILLFTSCKKDIILESDHKFPEKPVNLEMVNSKYDDYNSDLPAGEYDMFPLLFSSNRNSKGDNFDFNIFSMSMSFPFDKDIVSIAESAGTTYTHSILNEKVDEINTDDNQFGPYVYYLPQSTDIHEQEFIFFYAEGAENDLDIKYFLHELIDNPTIHDRYKWSDPFDLKVINSSNFSEAYISIQDDKIFYCSNSNGNYDICEKIIPQGSSIIDFLQNDNDMMINPIDELNSDADDKCPYVLDDFIVFVSNRAGGYGGFDLWYSKKTNDTWSAPVNFGAEINSEYDEYRPIFRKYNDIENDMMIFSSNRPGGKGGFDLYYVGIDETK